MKRNDRRLPAPSWGRALWEPYRIDPYWIEANPKFAYPGPWCNDENGYVADWGQAPKF